MTKTERITALEEARELIVGALVLIREATEGDAYVENYLCAPLSIIVVGGVYISHDVTIDWVIEQIKENGPDENDDDEGTADDNDNMADIDNVRGRGHMGKDESDLTLSLGDISHKTGAHFAPVVVVVMW